MAYTAAQLAAKVGIKLGIIGTGSSLVAADQTVITDAYAALYDLLQRKYAVDWGPDDSIPVWAMLPIRDIVANRVAGEFSKPRDATEEALAMKELKSGLAIDNAEEPAKVRAY